jgi:hypothetical protein
LILFFVINYLNFNNISTILKACNNQCLFGQCVSTGYSLQNCACFPGYTGNSCQTDIDECSSLPCLNGGKCTQPFINMYSCTCAPGFTGNNCQSIIPICDQQPCLNGGLCRIIDSVSYSCLCLPGTTGTK